MLPHATDWYRGRSVAAGHLRSVGGIRPAQTEMIPVPVDPRETAPVMGQLIPHAETCKQPCRALLVRSTYG